MKFKILFFLIIVSAINIPAQSDSIYTELLSEYVSGGLVNYEKLSSDSRLDEYISRLSKFNPADLKTEKERLAFWINAYNACTLKIISDNYPIESVNELHTGGRIIAHIIGETVWDKELVVINNKKFTLNHIEHEIIRKKFNEPRIHFALVCAALSCPPLRNEAFTADKLDAQLFNQGKIFFADTFKNKFDLKNRTAYLSKILDWYDDDFGSNDSEILIYISQFLNPEIKKDILNNTEKWGIDYISYDWKLNDIKNRKEK